MGRAREQTAYDHVIQATSGIMASTGTEEVNPIKIGAPAVDYATGTMGAFALASALFQREKTGRGQHIDLAMLGVAMMMQGSPLTGYFWNGSEPKPKGNRQPYATNSAYDAKEGMVMIGASNLRQQARFWRAVERRRHDQDRQRGARAGPRARSGDDRGHHQDRRPPTNGRRFFQARHVPAARVRTMAEALADPQFESRRIVPPPRISARGRWPVRGAARRVQVRAWRAEHRDAAARVRGRHRSGAGRTGLRGRPRSPRARRPGDLIRIIRRRVVSGHSRDSAGYRKS